jgi:hypothetical protein
MICNDIPGELRDKIRLGDVLNKILKNNGFIDANEINNTILDLKTKVNTLLSNVLGLEHDIDGVHNYDDGPLQNQITELKGNLVDFVNDINRDINTLSSQLTGINTTSSKISLTNAHEIDARVDLGGENLGARIIVSGLDVAIEAIGENPATGDETLKGRIIVGGGTTLAGIDLSSINNISLANLSGSHHMKITSEQIEMTDVNGLRISSDNDGVIITDYAGGKWVHLPWEI